MNTVSALTSSNDDDLSSKNETDFPQAESILTEAIDFKNKTSVRKRCIVIGEVWPSWLPSIIACNFVPILVFGNNLSRIQHLFPTVDKHKWRSSNRFKVDHIPKQSVIFVSGPIEFLELLNLSNFDSDTFIIVEGSQPNRRRLRRLGILEWYRIRHRDCGGVTSAQYWYAKIIKDLNPPGLYPVRHLIHVLSSASKEFQTQVFPPDDTSLKNSVWEENNFVMATGLMPIDDILNFIECPSVFTSTKWCRRKLSVKEIADILDLPVSISEECRDYNHKKRELPFLKCIPSKITQFVLQRVGLGNQRDIKIMNKILRNQRKPIPFLFAPPLEDEANLKAVKFDDAGVQNSIWDKRVLSIRRELKYNSDIANKLNKIRGLLVIRWRKNVWNSFFRYLKINK